MTWRILGIVLTCLKEIFTIKNGVMNTTNSYIDGPVAYASMKGDLDVVKQLYDVELHISPHITASLPIVATIAGGPIAGVAAWVASKIINQGMQRVTGYTYKVSGPWLDPVVQQVSIYKRKSLKNNSWSYIVTMWVALNKRYWQVSVFKETPANTPYSPLLLGTIAFCFYIF